MWRFIEHKNYFFSVLIKKLFNKFHVLSENKKTKKTFRQFFHSLFEIYWTFMHTWWRQVRCVEDMERDIENYWGIWLKGRLLNHGMISCLRIRKVKNPSFKTFVGLIVKAWDYFVRRDFISRRFWLTCKSCFAASAPALVLNVTNPTGWKQ